MRPDINDIYLHERRQEIIKNLRTYIWMAQITRNYMYLNHAKQLLSMLQAK